MNRLTFAASLGAFISLLSIGAMAPGAPVQLVNPTAPVKVFFPTDGALGTTWTGMNEPFNDTAWRSGQQGVGYARDAPDPYDAFIGLDVQNDMYRGGALPTSVYIRIPFSVSDPLVYSQLTLRMRYDDGFIAYLNGYEADRRNVDTNNPGCPPTPAWNSCGTDHSDQLAVVPEIIDMTDDLSKLRSGINVLAIHGLNVSNTSSDALFQAELTAESLQPVGLEPFRLFTTDAAVRVLVPSDGNLGLTWTGGNEPFDDSTTAGWIHGRQGVGFEGPLFPPPLGGYTPYLNVHLNQEMYERQTVAFIRLPFQAPSSAILGMLTLRVRYDDGFFPYLNGNPLPAAARNAVEWSFRATALHPDSEAVVFEDIDLSAYLPDLKTGPNLLAVTLLNRDLNSSDALFQAELVAELNPTPPPIEWPLADGGSGHFYQLVFTDGVSWSDAKTAAENAVYLGKHGHLVTINSQAEWDFLVKNLPIDHVWIGLSDAAQEGTFQWVTGEPVAFTAWGVSPQEPSNSGDEDYVYYERRSTGWGWNDKQNETHVGGGAAFPFRYLIEYPVPEPSTGVLAILGAASLAALRLRRFRRA